MTRSSKYRLQSSLAEKFPEAFSDKPHLSEFTGTGITELDLLIKGFEHGGITEIYGPESSGRTTIAVSFLAQVTAKEKLCAVVDASDSLDPESLEIMGVDLARLLWIRCGDKSQKEFRPFVANTFPANRRENQSGFPRALKDKASISRNLRHPRPEAGGMKDPRWDPWLRLEQALKVTDLLLHSGWFDAVLMDLAGVPPEKTRRIPMTSWFRFRRAIENTPTVFVVLTAESCVHTCASLILRCGRRREKWSHLEHEFKGTPLFLNGLELEVEVCRQKNRRSALSNPLIRVARYATSMTWNR